MMTLRRISAVLVGAYIVMWFPAVFVRLVNVPFGVGVALLVLAALLGGYGGYHKARALRPYARREHRDAVIGWSIALVPIGVIASFLVPMPWALVVAALWVVAVVAVARSLLASALGGGSPQTATGSTALEGSTRSAG